MSKKNVCLHIILIYFVFISNCFADSKLPYKEGELLVRFAPKADGKQRTLAERNAVLSEINGGTIKHSYKLVSGLSVVKLPAGFTVVDAIPRLQGKNEILYAEPNYKLKQLSTFPYDTRFDELWGMHNMGQTGGTIDADIDAPEVWDIVTDASNIIVAVIDSGINYDHNDLAANMWINTSEIADNNLTYQAKLLDFADCFWYNVYQ